MLMNNDYLEQAYNSYFNKNTSKAEKVSIPTNKTKKKDLSQGKLHADGNISSINEFAKILKLILDCTVGEDKITLRPAAERSVSNENTNFPLITYDVNSREVSEGKSIKPVLTDNIKETINGKETGNIIQVYRQWYDCLVEFDIYGINSNQTDYAGDKLDEILSMYTGVFKKAGISEMFFIKEIPPKSSVNYVPDISMSCFIWFIRLEKIYTVKASEIKNISIEVDKFIKNKNLKPIEGKPSVDIYNNNEITYDL